MRRKETPAPTLDYGLLVAAATVDDQPTARTVRDLLRTDGIRATFGPAWSSPGGGSEASPRRGSAPGRKRRGPAGTEAGRNPVGGNRWRVLVFPEDALRAYHLLWNYTS